jgi:hypothetical protein
MDKVYQKPETFSAKNVVVDGNSVFPDLFTLLVNKIQHDALKDCFIPTLYNLCS